MNGVVPPVVVMLIEPSVLPLQEIFVTAGVLIVGATQASPICRFPKPVMPVAWVVVPVLVPTVVAFHPLLYRLIIKLAGVVPASRSPGLMNVSVASYAGVAGVIPLAASVQKRFTVLDGLRPEVLIFVSSLPVVLMVKVPTELVTPVKSIVAGV